jgi:hypothetical protein
MCQLIEGGANGKPYAFPIGGNGMDFDKLTTFFRGDYFGTIGNGNFTAAAGFAVTFPGGVFSGWRFGIHPRLFAFHTGGNGFFVGDVESFTVAPFAQCAGPDSMLASNGGEGRRAEF